MKRVLNPEIKRHALIREGDCFLIHPSRIVGCSGDQFCFCKITEVYPDSFKYESLEFRYGTSMYLSNIEKKEGFYPIARIAPEFYDEIFEMNDSILLKIRNLIRSNAVHIDRIHKGDMILSEEDKDDGMVCIVYRCDRYRNVYADVSGVSSHSYNGIGYDPTKDIEGCMIYEAPSSRLMPAMKISEDIASEANQMYSDFTNELMPRIKEYLKKCDPGEKTTFYYISEDSLYIYEAEESDLHGEEELPF